MLEDYFRGRNTEGLDLRTMFGDLEPTAESVRHAATPRLRVLAEKGTKEQQRQARQWLARWAAPQRVPHGAPSS